MASTEMTGGPEKIKIDADVYLVLQEGKMKVDDAVKNLRINGSSMLRGKATTLKVN